VVLYYTSAGSGGSREMARLNIAHRNTDAMIDIDL
jgi:hypothetical protein